MITEEFQPFNKIGRLSREIVITEKIDGTNGIIQIGEDGYMLVGSRNRWLVKVDNFGVEWGEQTKKGAPLDNYGFGHWALDNYPEILKLGPGRHFGEWWGEGIQRGYGIKGKAFSLFNADRWADDALRPSCCRVVPILWRGEFNSLDIGQTMEKLETYGSTASPGFMRPEGIVIWHAQARVFFKKTFEADDAGKGKESILEMAA